MLCKATPGLKRGNHWQPWTPNQGFKIRKINTEDEHRPYHPVFVQRKHNFALHNTKNLLEEDPHSSITYVQLAMGTVEINLHNNLHICKRYLQEGYYICDRGSEQQSSAFEGITQNVWTWWLKTTVQCCHGRQTCFKSFVGIPNNCPEIQTKSPKNRQSSIKVIIMLSLKISFI